jgi:hypothetical protein
MKHSLYLSVGLMGAMMAFSGQTLAANTCQADTLTCATRMPVGGYGECTSYGNTSGGTVVENTRAIRNAHLQQDNATAGGCGAHPNAPGCH